MALITGNTYPVRVQLKAMGGVWDPRLRGWLVPDDRADEARVIVAHFHATLEVRQATARTCKTCGCKIRYGVYCGKCEFGR